MSAWLIGSLAATTALMLLVLLLRGPVARRFGARTAYLLWLLPALRMILPPLPESLGPAPIAQIPVMIDLSVFAQADRAPLAALPAEPGFPWLTLLLAVWLAGVVIHLGYHLLAYRRFVREALHDRTDLPELDVRGIEVCASRAVEGPFATGIFVPLIVLPHDYRTRYSAEELRLAMRHEAVHHDRGDLSVNLFALVMLSIHWFNPVAHRAWRAFRADQELACDAVVLRGADGAARHSYGLALVKSACARTPVAACALTPRDQLKARLRMMKAGERRGAGLVLAALLVSGGLALTASGGIAAETTRQIRHEVTEKVIAPAAQAVGMAPPAPPAPPAPAAPAAEAEDPRAAAEEARQDAEEARRDAEVGRSGALGEAAQARREALEEAAQARRGALEELRAAREEVRAVKVAARATLSADPVTGHYAFASGTPCRRGQSGDAVSVSLSGGGGAEQNTSVVICGRAMSEAEIAKITRNAMVQARDGLRRRGDIAPGQLAKALAAMDKEIARLEAIY